MGGDGLKEYLICGMRSVEPFDKVIVNGVEGGLGIGV
jgi:hypothetical protein